MDPVGRSIAHGNLPPRTGAPQSSIAANLESGSALTLGARLSGTFALGEDGAARIMTPAGSFTLLEKGQLPREGEVVLTIASVEPLRVRVASASTLPSPNAPTASETSQIADERPFVAVVLQSARAPSGANDKDAAGPSGMNWTPGTPVVVKTVQIEAGNAQPHHVPQAPVPAAASVGAALPPTAATVTGTIASVLMTGERVLLLADAACLLLPPSVGGRTGDRVSLRLLASSKGVPASAAQKSGIPAAAMPSGAGRETLSPALQVLAQWFENDADPKLQQSFAETFPSLEKADVGAVSRSLQRWLAALQSRNPKIALGRELSSALCEQRPDLLEALTRDVEERAAPQPDGQPRTWTNLTLPLTPVDAGQCLRIAWRENGRDRQAPQQNRQGQRFVVDVSLSQIGRVQVDALVRRGADTLALMLRCQHTLPAEAKQQIRAILDDCGARAALATSVDFRTEGYVEPASLPAGHTGRGIAS